MPPPPSARALRRKSTVLLVDDHQLVRDGLRLIIDGTEDLSVCADVPDAEQARHAIGTLHPDVALVDMSLGSSLEGLELVKWITARHPEIRSVVASMHDEGLYGERALRAGASGYVSKSAPARQVLDAIRSARDGRLHFSERLLSTTQRRSRHASGQRSLIETLSDRELQVLRCIGQGLASKEIAASLQVSVSSVDTYRERLKSKLGLSSGNELVHWATRWVLENG
jgi:DNA-binding NarL/FixJ family response regulator